MRVLCPGPGREGHTGCNEEGKSGSASPDHLRGKVRRLPIPAQLISREWAVKPFLLDSCPYVGGRTYGLVLLVWIISRVVSR